jgi:ribosomal protein L11 methyltransferase
MEYAKIKCTINPDNELNREILIAMLGEEGFESFNELEKNIEAFIPSTDLKKELLPDIFNNITLFRTNYVVEIIPDQNWNEVWEKNYFKPLLINNECLIRAPFHTEYPDAEYEIVIEPQMAFGTGNHETTSLVISKILEQNTEEKKILDMGCGTGILGILASMKGAKEITAIDIDKWAYNNTIENAQINGISNIAVKQGNAEILGGEKYDIIYANIQRNILLNDMETYASVMNKGAEIVMSGFYTEDLTAIKEEAKLCGLAFKEFSEKNNWVAAVFIKE